jgi:TPR repeat protein
MQAYSPLPPASIRVSFYYNFYLGFLLQGTNMRYDLTQVIDPKSIDIDELVALANQPEPDPSALFLGSYIAEDGYNRLSAVGYNMVYDWALHGAKLGDPLCQARYGVLRYSGQWMRASHKEGHIYLKNSRAWILEKANEGHPYAQTISGLMYGRGWNVPLNLSLAHEWLQKAGNREQLGEPCAQFHLGECYEFERGVSKDFQRAAEWYGKPAEMGHIRAQTNLGFLIVGNPETDDEARDWWMKAAQQEWVVAQHYLGDWYEGKIRNTSPNYPLAFAWYKRAADQNYPDSVLKLAGYYENGHGTEQNMAEALSLYLYLLSRDGNVVDTAQLKRKDRQFVEQRIRVLKLKAKSIVNPETKGKGWEFADGSVAWEAPAAPAKHPGDRGPHAKAPHHRK